MVDQILADLERIVAESSDRSISLQMVADLLKASGRHRWVGLYEVDGAVGVVRNLAWSGPSAPEYPTFPITKGLTSVAISCQKTVNVGDVRADPRYLTALVSTKSEIIVPVFDRVTKEVRGTIDVESQELNAFTQEAQALLEACSSIIEPLWQQ
jgi:putative methionine-R-sulfoxide reductase with GAF domain